MKKTDNNLLNLLAFISLVILAVLIVVNNFLPIIGINTTGVFFTILKTIQSLLTIIVIGVSAYNFVCNKSKAIKITYWVCIALFVAGIVLMWFVK